MHTLIINTNLKTFGDVSLNAPVIIRMEVKKCEQTPKFIAMLSKDTSLEVKGQEDAPSPHVLTLHCLIATHYRDFKFSISVEAHMMQL